MVRFLTGMGLGLLLAGLMVIFLVDTFPLEKFLIPFGMTLLVLPMLLRPSKTLSAKDTIRKIDDERTKLIDSL